MPLFSKPPAPKTRKAIKQQFCQRHRRFHTKAQRALWQRVVTPADRKTLRRCAGLAKPFPALLASNGRLRWKVAKSLFLQLEQARADHPDWDFCLVTLVLDDWATSDELTRIPLTRLKRRSRYLLTQISPHHVSTVELQAFANVKHLSGGRLLGPHTHAIVFGPDALTRGKALAKHYNAKLGPQGSGVAAIDVQPIGSTRADLLRAVRYPHKGLDRLKSLYIHPRTGRRNLHESETGDRYVRYLRLFQLLSLMPLERLMFAGGDGCRLLSTALQVGRDAIKAKFKALDEPGTLARLEGFWAELMPRLGNDRFRLPRFD